MIPGLIPGTKYTLEIEAVVRDKDGNIKSRTTEVVELGNDS
jgi:hypothetical protein